MTSGAPPPSDPAGAHRLAGPELVLVRHGETTWSRSRRHTGRTDVPLTDVGRRHAAHIGAALAELAPDRVLASPLSRAWDTARLAGLTPERDDDLLEWDYGEFEGTTTAEVRARIPGWSVWTAAIPDGESVEDVGRRADRVIARLRGGSGRIALVAHAHLLRVLGARWVGLPPVAGRHFVLDTATLSVLGWERETPVVVRWNERCTG
jgi:probable phosphoglycerate mutase